MKAPFGVLLGCKEEAKCNDVADRWTNPIGHDSR